MIQDDGSPVRLFPERASTAAGAVDGLTLYLLGVTLAFSLLIFVLILAFAIKYRRRTEGQLASRTAPNPRLEVLWTVVPLLLTLVMFYWGARLYLDQGRLPEGALPITVVGKQWMWKIRHPGGQREVNELHVPVGRPVVLRLGSEDVIHSFYVPAFRLKMDAVPGRTSNLWFQATRPGTYWIFCAEYCGTLHSRMIGRLVAMEPRRYEQWLGGGAGGESLASGGERLFLQLGCASCHHPESGARGPDLAGLFGRTVTLQNGEKVVADEAYLRESIVAPNAKLVAGYAPQMPTYQGQLGEEGLLQVLEYLKSLKRGREAR